MATGTSRNESVQRFLRTPQCSPYSRLVTAAAKNDAVLDTKKLITEVKRRPAIYDMNCLQYNDRHAKSDAWYEVCVAMVENWDELTTEEKNVEEKILRNKWRNTRDYFMKELKAPKKRKTSKAGRKRTTYSYYNELLFLLPSLKNRRVVSKPTKSKSVKAVQRLKNEVEIHEVIELESSPRVEEFSLTGVSLASSESQRDVYQQHQVTTCEASMASFDNEIQTDVLSTAHGSQRTFNSESDDDYDKMFLLSLLPSLRCVPEHVKLHVRIQMQQVIASAFHPSNHHAE